MTTPTPLLAPLLERVEAMGPVLAQGLSGHHDRSLDPPFLSLCRADGVGVFLVADSQAPNRLAEWPSTRKSAHQRIRLMRHLPGLTQPLQRLTDALMWPIIRQNAHNHGISSMFIRFWTWNTIELALVGGSFFTQRTTLNPKGVADTEAALQHRLALLAPYAQDTGAQRWRVGTRFFLADTPQAAKACFFAFGTGRELPTIEPVLIP